MAYLQTVEGPRPHWMAVAKQLLADLPEFCRIVPYQVKKIAVKDACQALSTNKLKAKNTGQSFKLRFKSRKSPTQSCFIPKSAVKPEGVYYTISGGLKYAEDLPETIQDSRLILHRGRWYLSVPFDKKITRTESQGRVVAVDPGVRSFATFFGAESFGHIGYHDIGRIQRLCYWLDNLISRMSKAKSKVKHRMKQAANRIRNKINDLVSEIHWKTCRFLVDNFDVIIFPTFEVANMVLKKTRKLRSKSVRQMLSWSIYKFSQRLEQKCFEMGKTLIRISEAYTSKTNSFSGELMNIGSREWFDFGGIRINRDVNGARNILIRALVDSPWVKNNPAFVSKC